MQLSFLLAPSSEGWPALHEHESKPKRARLNGLDVVFFFEQLLPEIQQLVIDRVDMATRFSFSWTNRKYYQLIYKSDEFNPYRFADKCAECGYRQLLAYSVENGGPYDLYSISIAAKNGYVFPELSPDNDAVRKRIYEGAALGGHEDLAKEMYRAHFCECEADPLALIKLALQGGQLDGALRIYGSVAGMIFPSTFCQLLLTIGLKHGHAELVAESLRRQPSLLSRISIDEMLYDGAEMGCMRFIELALSHGAAISAFLIPAIIESQVFISQSQHFDCLVFVYQNMPFGEPIRVEYDDVPFWATPDSLAWMMSRGFKFNPNRLLTNYLNIPGDHLRIEVLAWILQQNGVVVNLADIKQAARYGRTDLLDMLWSKKPNNVVPDDMTLNNLFGYLVAKGSLRLCLNPIKKTVRWLLDKNFSWGRSLRIYGFFAKNLHQRNPRRAGEFIQETGMPLSELRRRAIFASVMG